MTTSEKWKIALKITIILRIQHMWHLHFLKGENKALQMLVSIFLEAKSSRKLGKKNCADNR